ncbi:MAG: hypothetical protein ACE5HX_15925, partial [bacterium]
MIFKTRLLFLFTLFLLNTTGVFSQTDVYLKVYQKTFQRMEIDLYPMVGESRGKASEIITGLITEVLRNDLWMSGYFKVNIKAGAPQLQDAASRNSTDGGSKALAAVAGKFQFHHNSMTIQPHVVDIASRRTIIKNDYTDRIEQARYLVHKISDDIVYSLTGEQGIATSKIAFVRQKKDGSKEIAVMDYDGQNLKEVTFDKSINLSPA